MATRKFLILNQRNNETAGGGPVQFGGVHRRSHPGRNAEPAARAIMRQT
jgi:hypothetical protein